MAVEVGDPQIAVSDLVVEQPGHPESPASEWSASWQLLLDSMAKSVGDGAKRRRPPLSEETADADLSKMSGSDWQPLLELRRRIDQAESFTIKSENSVWPIWTEVVKDFHKIVYDLPIVVSFDWKAWDSGRAALRDPSHDFGEESLVDLCKMITTIVRAERFNEGFLPGKFKDGTISRILDAIDRHIDR